MSEIHSYSKVYALGHSQLVGLTDEPVLIAEKLDGSQFGFGILEGVLRFRSKGVVVYPQDTTSMFANGVAAICEIADQLTAGYIYRCEYFKTRKQNAIQYDRVPARHVVIFDIEDMNAGPYHFLAPDKVQAECERLGLEHVVPEAYDMVTSKEMLEVHMKKPSLLGGPREGVVLKNYSRCTADGKTMMGKYVSEKFKEVNSLNWKVTNPNKGNVVATLIERLSCEARYLKAVQHLRERGELTETVQDIGPLIREVQTDVLTEETERIKEALFQWAKGDITRGISGKIPQWYKDVLAAKQFESSSVATTKILEH